MLDTVGSTEVGVIRRGKTHECTLVKADQRYWMALQFYRMTRPRGRRRRLLLGVKGSPGASRGTLDKAARFLIQTPVLTGDRLAIPNITRHTHVMAAIGALSL